MTDYLDLTDWLKAQTDTFETKKRMLVFTDLIHKPTGEKVIEGFRYFHSGIDELVAAFDADDVDAIRDLEYAFDDDGDVDTSAVCLQLAYTASGAFLAAQPQEYRDYVPTLVGAAKYLTVGPNARELVFALDQSS
jgi:hypothetical protein